MRRLFVALLILGFCVGGSAAWATNTPTQTPTVTPTATPTETPTETPTQTPTNTPADMNWFVRCDGECEPTPAAAPTAKHIGTKTLTLVLMGPAVEGVATCRACTGCPVLPIEDWAMPKPAGTHVHVTEQVCIAYGARITRCDGTASNKCEARLFVTK